MGNTYEEAQELLALRKADLIEANDVIEITDKIDKLENIPNWLRRLMKWVLRVDYNTQVVRDHIPQIHEDIATLEKVISDYENYVAPSVFPEDVK